MRKLRTTIVGLSALAFVGGLGVFNTADAGVKVRATYRTPTVRVAVGTTPAKSRVIVTGHRRHNPKYGYWVITERDRDIAFRLSRYTGVPERRILRMRRRGYNWTEIGERLRLPYRIVEAAKYQRSWRRFLRHQRRHDRCDYGCCDTHERFDRRGHRGHGAIYFDAEWDRN